MSRHPTIWQQHVRYVMTQNPHMSLPQASKEASRTYKRVSSQYGGFNAGGEIDEYYERMARNQAIEKAERERAEREQQLSLVHPPLEPAPGAPSKKKVPPKAMEWQSHFRTVKQSYPYLSSREVMGIARRTFQR